jgi:hypothetical protein
MLEGCVWHGTHFLPFSASLQAITTWKPLAASPVAAWSPIPPLPPVTRATLPLSFANSCSVPAASREGGHTLSAHRLLPISSFTVSGKNRLCLSCLFARPQRHPSRHNKLAEMADGGSRRVKEAGWDSGVALWSRIPSRAEIDCTDLRIDMRTDVWKRGGKTHSRGQTCWTNRGREVPSAGVAQRRYQRQRPSCTFPAHRRCSMLVRVSALVCSSAPTPL